MNLFSAAERLAAIDRSQVTFEQGRCLRSLSAASTCRLCADLCPAGAIQVEEQARFSAEQCRGCLACLPACPTGAFSADDAVPGLLTCAARIENARVELVCKQHPDCRMGLEEDGVALQLRGCLAGLGAGAYLSLAALGLSCISVRVDGCPGCPWGALATQIEGQLDVARQILAAYGKEVLLKTVGADGAKVERPVWDAENPPLSRRDLFRFASRQGQVALARGMAAERAGHGPQPSRDRQRMHAAIAHFTTENPVQNGSLVQSGFACLEVSDECTACGVCERACPSGALELVKDEARYALKYSAWKCSGCEICLQVCAQNALRIDRQPSIQQAFGQDEVELRSGELARCQRCNTWFASKAGEQFCPACEFRRSNPFGSKLPPGMDLAKLRSSGRKL